jgi:glutamine amidotransferase
LPIVVLDYGSGNIRSAERGIARTGAKVEVSNDVAKARAADALVIPGVGAFAACMKALRDQGFADVIVERAQSGAPMLGICVGMQIMFETGTETLKRDGPPADHKGLGIWQGTVEAIKAPVVPHMGWNTVNSPSDSKVFAGLGEQRFYFVHSYAAKSWTGAGAAATGAGAVAGAGAGAGAGGDAVVTTCDYGDGFIAAVEAGPIWGTQFHPEKSGEAGLKLLDNWVKQL